ncbi:MAG: GNAT family N-acetyltransferase [Actinomycetales bacterium]|nr:GNAT family N-acetyltransferase [Actinomycetales bacterium]
MPDPEPDLVLRSDDPRIRQAEADGWECVATSWGARLDLDRSPASLPDRLRQYVVRAAGSGYGMREIRTEDVAQVLDLDALTARDYPGGTATRHEPLDEAAAKELLAQGRAWGAWEGDTLVALTATRMLSDRVETDFTAVHPEHRRRGLATAVKAASVLAHAQDGATRFGTGGAADNVASLAMNRAVGYEVIERWHTYRRRAADVTVRGTATDAELNALHAAAFGHPSAAVPWNDRLTAHSLTWVTARTPADGTLVGFVNVIGDGGAHAVLLDTMVHPDLQRHGVGRELVRVAARDVTRRGCHWLHADYPEDAAVFYEEACGLSPTWAGLLRLGP